MSAIVMHSTPPGIEPRSSSSPTQSCGFATATLCSRSPGRSWVDIGSATAPIRHAASMVSTHSTRLPARVITTSPRSTPRAARAPDTPALIAISSPKCHTRRSPLASMASSAGLADGNCSRTSEMKFTDLVWRAGLACERGAVVELRDRDGAFGRRVQAEAAEDALVLVLVDDASRLSPRRRRCRPGTRRRACGPARGRSRTRARPRPR